MTLADRVVVMNAGLIEQVGSPNDLYHSPATKFVAGFIGSPAMNFEPCHLETAAGRCGVAAERHVWPSRCRPTVRRAIRGHVGKANLVLGLRPEHIIETRPHVEPNQHDFDTMIDVVEPMAWRRWSISPSRARSSAAGSTPNAGATAGKVMKLRADLSNMHLIDDGTGRVL